MPEIATLGRITNLVHFFCVVNLKLKLLASSHELESLPSIDSIHVADELVLCSNVGAAADADGTQRW